MRMTSRVCDEPRAALAASVPLTQSTSPEKKVPVGFASASVSHLNGVAGAAWG
jgi:hypothetical protein